MYILCNLSNLLITSHHNAILTKLSTVPTLSHSLPPVNKAPHVDIPRYKDYWQDLSDPHYSTLISEVLLTLTQNFPSKPTHDQSTALISSVNSSLGEATATAHKTTPLCQPDIHLKTKNPPKILKLVAKLRKSNRTYKKLMKNKAPKFVVQQAPHKKISVNKDLKEQVIKTRKKQQQARYNALNSINTTNSSAVFKTLCKAKLSTSLSLYRLTVGKTDYCGNDVPDVFLKSLADIKVPYDLQTSVDDEELF